MNKENIDTSLKYQGTKESESFIKKFTAELTKVIPLQKQIIDLGGEDEP